MATTERPVDRYQINWSKRKKKGDSHKKKQTYRILLPSAGVQLILKKVDLIVEYLNHKYSGWECEIYSVILTIILIFKNKMCGTKRVNILFCVNRIRTETFWLKFFVLIRATESHPALWLREMQVTSEWCPPLITVLDRQQLDKAAWVAVPLGLSVAKGFQYTVDLHFPSIIWHYGLSEFLYYLYISIT